MRGHRIYKEGERPPVPGRLAGLRLVRDTAVERPPGYHTRSHVGCPVDVVVLLRPFAEVEPAETLWLLALDTQHRLIGTPIVVTRGILNQTLCHTREIFRAAIVAGAVAVVLVHNHTSGDPEPSPADLEFTLNVAAAGRMIDIPVLDHIILGDPDHYVSLAERRVL